VSASNMTYYSRGSSTSTSWTPLSMLRVFPRTRNGCWNIGWPMNSWRRSSRKHAAASYCRRTTSPWMAPCWRPGLHLKALSQEMERRRRLATAFPKLTTGTLFHLPNYFTYRILGRYYHQHMNMVNLDINLNYFTSRHCSHYFREKFTQIFC
jgi:hypothetical protein